MANNRKVTRGRKFTHVLTTSKKHKAAGKKSMVVHMKRSPDYVGFIVDYIK